MINQESVFYLLRPLFDGPMGQVIERISGHFSDPSRRLPEAIERARRDALNIVELALIGDGLFDQVRQAVSSAASKSEFKRLQERISALGLERETCLAEFERARTTGPLSGRWCENAAIQGGPSAELNELEGVKLVVARLGERLRGAGLDQLAKLLGSDDYFVTLFRSCLWRHVEADPELHRALDWEEGKRQHREVIEQINRLMTAVDESQPDSLDQELALVKTLEDAGMRAQAVAVVKKVTSASATLHLMGQTLAPANTGVLSNATQRKAILELEARFRALPFALRRQLHNTAHRLDQLLVALGETQRAEQHLRVLADGAGPWRERARVWYDTYWTALEQQAYGRALEALLEAARLDPESFAPFPLTDYQPREILGAGGFGVAFLCEQQVFRKLVVVKTLHRSPDLSRDLDSLLHEAQVLSELNHPGLVKVLHAGFVGRARERAYLVLERTEGRALDAILHDRGTLSSAETRSIARAVAEALHAAHSAGVLHLDLKPENILAREHAPGQWHCTVIDFGLAMRMQSAQATYKQIGRDVSILARAVGGTLKYASPEQLEDNAVPVDRYSDVFAFGRTLCKIRLGTQTPSKSHWDALADDADLASLIDGCIQERPKDRFADFAALLAQPALAQPAAAPNEAQNNAQNDADALFAKGDAAIAREDIDEAVSCLHTAGAQGHAQALTALGELYYAGRGTGPAYDRAFECFKKAAARGESAAGLMVAYMELFGLGTAKAPERARDHFRELAEGGDSEAMFALGRMYWAGLGVEADRSRGRTLLTQAHELGHTEAGRWVARVEPR